METGKINHPEQYTLRRSLQRILDHLNFNSKNSELISNIESFLREVETNPDIEISKENLEKIKEIGDIVYQGKALQHYIKNEVETSKNKIFEIIKAESFLGLSKELDDRINAQKLSPFFTKPRKNYTIKKGEQTEYTSADPRKEIINTLKSHLKNVYHTPDKTLAEIFIPLEIFHNIETK